MCEMMTHLKGINHRLDEYRLDHRCLQIVFGRICHGGSLMIVLYSKKDAFVTNANQSLHPTPLCRHQYRTLPLKAFLQPMPPNLVLVPPQICFITIVFNYLFLAPTIYV